MADRDVLPTTLPAAATSGLNVVDTALPALNELGDQHLTPTQLLGKGGMGEVWECRDAALGRELAMKQSTATDPMSQGRFVREARVQGQLEHPSIVPVHELGLRGGRPFFTMKRVRGVTLAEVLRRLSENEPATLARFPRHRLLSVVQTLAQTLDFAHSRGVVHRDLKPGNVMLGDFGEVYLLDWGLAKVGAAESGRRDSGEVVTEPNATMAGAVMGTPGYMSPEQASGELATAASDVWALGALLFEMMTLEALVQGRSSLELLSATHAPFPALRDRKTSADVSPELDALCTRALSRDPRDRPTARAFSDGLDAVLSGQRDVELREALASQHAARAQSAAELALREGALNARREALHEIGRALALSPEQPLARKTFATLLQAPPSIDPPEVTAEVERLQSTLTSAGSTNGLLGYLGMAPFLLVALWMGIRDLSALMAMNVAWAVLIGASMWAARNPPTTALMRWTVTGAGLLLAIAQSWVLGPFLIVPGLLTANALGLMMWVHKRERALVLLLSSVAVLVPLALQLLGWVEPFYVFEEGQLRVLPHALHLPMVPTLTMLGLSAIGTMAVSSVSMRRLRDTLDEAQRQLALQRWTLEQLGGERHSEVGK